MKNLNNFINRCNSENVPQSEIYDFIKRYDKKGLEYLQSDLNKYADSIKFTLILERTDADGTIEQTDHQTTIKSYIEKQQEALSLVLTPRQKIDFVLQDITDKGLNYVLFEDGYFGFLRFSDFVDAEYLKNYQTDSTDLISKSINFDEIAKPVNKFHFAALRAQYDFEFTVWLQENKGLKFGDAEHYNSLVTDDNWLLFLRYKKQLHDNTQNEFDNEKERRKAFIDNGKPAPEQKDFSGLLKNLTPLYINNCSTDDLHSIIIDKKLPLGRNPINWTGTKADAIRFIEHFSITKKQFNDMFLLDDGKPIHAGHKDKNETGSDLTDILKNH